MKNNKSKNIFTLFHIETRTITNRELSAHNYNQTSTQNRVHQKKKTQTKTITRTMPNINHWTIAPLFFDKNHPNPQDQRPNPQKARNLRKNHQPPLPPRRPHAVLTPVHGPVPISRFSAVQPAVQTSGSRGFSATTFTASSRLSPRPVAARWTAVAVLQWKWFCKVRLCCWYRFVLLDAKDTAAIWRYL